MHTKSLKLGHAHAPVALWQDRGIGVGAGGRALARKARAVSLASGSWNHG